MPPSPPDRALRRLIARLAEATADDREAILGDLSPEEQEVVSRLLADYRGLDIGSLSPPPATPSTAWATYGFSAQMIARLEAPAGFGMRIPSPPASADFARQAAPELTPRALEALRDCARQIRLQFDSPAPVVTTPRSEGGLFRRLFARRSL